MRDKKVVEPRPMTPIRLPGARRSWEIAHSTVSSVAMEKFDFVVIGGGSAGYAAARLAARSGLKSVCIDSGGGLLGQFLYVDL